MNQLLKRISALIIAVIMSVSLCLNTAVSVKANLIGIAAEFAFAELLTTILVGAGVIPAATAANMSLNELAMEFSLASGEASGEYIAMATNVTKSCIIDYLATDEGKELVEKVLGYAGSIPLIDWIKSHANSVEAVETVNFDMKGYGAVAHIKQTTISSGKINEYYVYGDYGTIDFGYWINMVAYSSKANGVLRIAINSNGVETKYYSKGDTIQAYSDPPDTMNQTYEFYGDWRLSNGTQYEDVAEPTTTAKPNIAEFEDEKGNTYTVSPDGVVTDSKGNTYTLNPDGSVTIDGITYYPEIDYSLYDIKALMDLVNQIAKSIPGTIPGEKDKEKDDSYVDDLIDSIPYPDAIEGFESLQMPIVISQVFPFCLPFDFVRGLQLLSEKPVAPKFKIPFTIPEFGEFKGLSSTYRKNGDYVNVYYEDDKYYIEVDLAKYDKIFNVVRWFFTALFVFALIFISTKIIKGAGS